MENILRTPDEALAELLRGASFHQRKTEYIKRSTRRLLEEYGGVPPLPKSGFSN